MIQRFLIITLGLTGALIYIALLVVSCTNGPQGNIKKHRHNQCHRAHNCKIISRHNVKNIKKI